MGQAAVEFSVNGKNAVMPIIQRESSKPYKWTVGEAPLSQVANQEKKMPIHYITDDGFGITEECREYLAPLIRGEDYPPYDDAGIPIYVKLQNTLVNKKLRSDFKV
jgi:6-phosphofructokinase 1